MRNNSNYEKIPQKEKRRFQAVLAMLEGQPLSDITKEYGICRSNLYRFRKRALKAMRNAMRDLPRGPRVAHNRIPRATEEQIKQECERYPTMSSYKINKKAGIGFPSPRTIQRIRARYSLPRLSKRVPARSRAKRFVPEVKQKNTKIHAGEKSSWGIAAFMGYSKHT